MTKISHNIMQNMKYDSVYRYIDNEIIFLVLKKIQSWNGTRQEFQFEMIFVLWNNVVLQEMNQVTTMCIRLDRKNFGVLKYQAENIRKLFGVKLLLPSSKQFAFDKNHQYTSLSEESSENEKTKLNIPTNVKEGSVISGSFDNWKEDIHGKALVPLEFLPEFSKFHQVEERDGDGLDDIVAKIQVSFIL